jgi:malto-oligosyltrehalose trehalohydrolase
MLNPESVPTSKLHRYLGARAIDPSGTRFSVWAPTHQAVGVRLVDQNRTISMQKQPGGYHVAEIDGVRTGDRYWYQFGNGPLRCDPASRFQPEGVHGPSEVVCPDAFDWTDASWRGVRREDLVIYELHIGAFTEQGTFAAAAARLDELVDLGVTAIELMPVADCPGKWNWGYDGVCLFAPNRNFGTPAQFRQLIDSAHHKGLAVILDVVYNHLGPEGNYLGDAGPYLSPRHKTLWGAAPNFDDPEHARQVRRFVIANAIHWFEEYHIDALRVDAIHCMHDDSEPHVTAEMSRAVRTWSGQTQRPAMLIAESNVYDPHMLAPLDQGGIGFDAEWCYDFLHSLYSVVRPGEQVCHRTYTPGTDLEQTLRGGYVYEGTLRKQRSRRPPRTRVDTTGLIYSIQTHDFIGNHPLGKRLHQLTSPDVQRAAAALLVLSPAIPMLFMGEEFACKHPFQFFVDFTEDQLRRAVVDGRKREYPQHDWSTGTLPIEPTAFHDSKIGRWQDGDVEMRCWYQSLIAVRKEWRSSGLLGDANLSVHNDLRRGLFALKYTSHQSIATVAARLVADPGQHRACQLNQPVMENRGRLILDSRPGASKGDQLLPNHAKVFLAED